MDGIRIEGCNEVRTINPFDKIPDKSGQRRIYAE